MKDILEPFMEGAGFGLVIIGLIAIIDILAALRIKCKNQNAVLTRRRIRKLHYLILLIGSFVFTYVYSSTYVQYKRSGEVVFGPIDEGILFVAVTISIVVYIVYSLIIKLAESIINHKR